MKTSIRRLSIPAQTAGVLREGVITARWQDHLPSEAELCRELQISRETLRKALAQLIADGLIASGGRGRSHRILHASGPTGRPHGKVIRILTSYGPQYIGELQLLICDHLREQAGRSGYRVEFETHPRLFQLHSPAAMLGRLSERPDTAGWVVFGSNEEIQRFFSDHDIPCVIIGPPHPGMRVTGVWPDTRASARHAAGLFHARGHRHVAYLLREVTSLGDRRGASAFAEEATHLGMRPRIVTYETDADQLCRAIDALMVGRQKPTGLFGYSGYDCLTMLTHLQSKGSRVPDDVSIISGWAESFLHATRPLIAHYRIDDKSAGRKIARLIIQRIERDPATPPKLVILPEFVAGGSLAECPASNGAKPRR